MFVFVSQNTETWIRPFVTRWQMIKWRGIKALPDFLLLFSPALPCWDCTKLYVDQMLEASVAISIFKETFVLPIPSLMKWQKSYWEKHQEKGRLIVNVHSLKSKEIHILAFNLQQIGKPLSINIKYIYFMCVNIILQ